MPSSLRSIVLLAAVVFFVAFLLMKSRMLGPKRRAGGESARRRLSQAKQRAAQVQSPEEKAQAWREAAEIALQDLRRPHAAALYARRADRHLPRRAETLRLLFSALKSAGKWRTLEDALWRRLGSESESKDGELDALMFEELVALYEGPMARPERARVLRRLRSPS